MNRTLTGARTSPSPHFLIVRLRVAGAGESKSTEKHKRSASARRSLTVQQAAPACFTGMLPVADLGGDGGDFRQAFLYACKYEIRVFGAV